MDFLSSLLDSPAKTLALQENKLGTMESEVYCFMKSSVLLGSFDLSSSCLKTLEIYSLTKTGRRSKKPSFKLPKQGTMQNGQLFQQVMWEPVTAGSESGLLPTPRRGETSDLKSKPGHSYSLSAWARQEGPQLLPTPRNCSAMAASVNTQGNLEKPRFPNLETVVGKMLPTPTRSDYLDPTWNYPPCTGVSRGEKLAWAMGAELGHNNGLNGEPGTNRSIPIGVPMYLSPSFVEEMMGYPIGWTDLNS
jgi:hypothetical protein